METNQTCKNCAFVFTGKYCNNCGQKFYTDHDRRIAHFFEESLHFITHFDTSFFRTLKTIFTRPGQLSRDYTYGKRKSYFKPLSFFLVLVIIYLLFPMFQALNMDLKYHLMHNVYGDYATKRIADILQHTNMSEAELAKVFHQKGEKTSKFLLLIILPLTALFYYALTFKKRPYFFDQLVYATEINSFYLLWGFLILPLLFIGFVLLLRALHFGTNFNDESVGVVLYLVLGIYVAISSRRFYGIKLWQAVILGILIYPIHFVVVQVIYKFLLFILVVNQIH